MCTVNIFCFALLLLSELLLLHSLTRRRELKYSCSTGVYKIKCEYKNKYGGLIKAEKNQAKIKQTNKQKKAQNKNKNTVLNTFKPIKMFFLLPPVWNVLC